MQSCGSNPKGAGFLSRFLALRGYREPCSARRGAGRRRLRTCPALRAPVVPQQVGAAAQVFRQSLPVVLGQHPGRAPVDELVQVGGVSLDGERGRAEVRAALGPSALAAAGAPDPAARRSFPFVVPCSRTLPTHCTSGKPAPLRSILFRRCPAALATSGKTSICVSRCPPSRWEIAYSLSYCASCRLDVLVNAYGEPDEAVRAVSGGVPAALASDAVGVRGAGGR